MMAEVVFWVTVGLVILGAFGAVLSNSLIYAVFFLLLTMGGIGGLYIYLGSPFLAMMQVLIYLGAVGVLLVFAVMLAGPFWLRPKERGRFIKVGLGSALGTGAVIALYKGLQHHRWEAAPPRVSSAEALGRLILDEYPLAFELISLLIVMSILGAIMLGLLSRGKGKGDAMG